MFDATTRAWVVSTITGFVLLAVWVASVLAEPLIVLDPAAQTAIFLGALGALGIQTVSSFMTVRNSAALLGAAAAEE